MGRQERGTGIAVFAAALLALTGCAGTGAPTSQHAPTTSVSSPAVVRIVMPDIIGMTLEQALEVLSGAHYEGTVRAPGAEMDWTVTGLENATVGHTFPSTKDLEVQSAPSPVATATPIAPTPAEPGPVEAVPAPSRDYPESAVDVAVAGSLPYLAAGTSDAAAGEIVMLVCNMLDSGSSPADVDAELADRDVGTESPRRWIIAFATGALCPAHADAVLDWSSGEM